MVELHFAYTVELLSNSTETISTKYTQQIENPI